MRRDRSPADPLLHQVTTLHVQVEHPVLSLHLKISVLFVLFFVEVDFYHKPVWWR